MAKFHSFDHVSQKHTVYPCTVTARNIIATDHGGGIENQYVKKHKPTYTLQVEGKLREGIYEKKHVMSDASSYLEFDEGETFNPPGQPAPVDPNAPPPVDPNAPPPVDPNMPMLESTLPPDPRPTNKRNNPPR